MAEAIVSTILRDLTSMAIQSAKEEWARLTGVDEEVKKLRVNLEAIQFVMEDAEEKQFLDKQVKHWLDRFKNVSYDMEDVLDDWKTAALQKQKMDDDDGTEKTSCWKNRVCSFASCFSSGSQVARRYDVAIRIQTINEELDQIAKDKDRYKLTKREVKQHVVKRDESTSFVDMSTLHGRDQIKEEIVRTILSGTSEEIGALCCFQIISIIGMGGIGKTALAQLISNDHRVKKHFQNNVIWICVSNSFDQIQIAKAILGGLNPHSTNLQNLVSLQTLLKEISEKIKEKRFFLVLDDVWTEDDQDWESLKASLQYGIPGSWILVTSRKESVARQMNLTRIIHVNPLSEEICWQILSQIAFTRRNKDFREKLEGIGKEIAKKCDGLPLAAKTLGVLLQDKQQRDEWRLVLESEIWESDIAQQKLFVPLLLSYYDLPSKVRQCLLYCAIFPQDHEISKDELIRQWMAQDYLKSNNSLESELEGEDYFRYLAGRCFFQDFEKDENGNIISCKMHDVVHDFVKFLTKSEFGVYVEDDVKDSKLDLSSKKVRHLRLVIAEGSHFPMSINGTENLRSLVAAYGRYKAEEETPGEAFEKLVRQSKRLRLLELQGFLINCPREFPRQIGSLIHLRYLRFSRCDGIEILPEEMCELYNLQTLSLDLCVNIKQLPVGMGKLINLRCLNTANCLSLLTFPKSIAKLTCLTRLRGIRARADVNDENEFSVGDLENLDHIGGEILIELTGNAINWDEFKRAKLHNKTRVKKIRVAGWPEGLDQEIVRAFHPLAVDLDFVYRATLLASRKHARNKPP